MKIGPTDYVPQDIERVAVAMCSAINPGGPYMTTDIEWCGSVYQVAAWRRYVEPAQIFLAAMRAIAAP